MSNHPHFSPISVQPVHLDAIMHRLDRLQRHSGQMNADDLWLDSNEPRCLTIHQLSNVNGSTQAIFNTTLASIQRMKGTLFALKAITTSLEEVLKMVQKQTQPALLHHGINSIPTEILSRIFVFACDPKTSQHLKLSHVCCRLREVAANLPQLWTYMSPRQSLEWRKLQISRSGNSPLTIDFLKHEQQASIVQYCPCMDTCSCMDYLDFVLQYAHRWREFNYATHHGWMQDQQARRQIQALLKDLHLPRLERLSVAIDCTRTGEDEAIRSWKTPRLQSLQCCRDMSPLLATVDSTVLSLHFTIMDPQSDVLRFFSHPKLAGIEDLSVKVDSYIFEVEPTDIDVPISLNSLRRLTIVFKFSYYTPDDIINYIFKQTQAPKLETLSVRFTSHSDDEDQNEYYEETDTDELMQEFETVCQWLGSPLPVFKKQFGALKLIEIYIEGHKEVDERTLESELKKTLRGAWQGADLEHDSDDFYDIIPEIDFTFERGLLQAIIPSNEFEE